MKLKIDMNNLEVSNDEILELLEDKLCFNYDNYCILDGAVRFRKFNSWDGCYTVETNIPVDVYEAYCTVRKYLIEKD